MDVGLGFAGRIDRLRVHGGGQDRLLQPIVAQQEPCRSRVLLLLRGGKDERGKRSSDSTQNHQPPAPASDRHHPFQIEAVGCVVVVHMVIEFLIRITLREELSVARPSSEDPFVCRMQQRG